MNYFYNRIFCWKHLWIIVLVTIFLIGAVLRLYNYGNLLVFKSDQARDALIMEQAVDGSIFELSLLGPQVGGTSLRLGPIHYYFQYLSGKFFGASPESFAYPDLLWGILALPLLFLLFRRFFSVSLSLWLTMLASCSFFLVTFSRFGWNPNGLPFFLTLFVWLFLYALDLKDAKRWWLLGAAAVSLGVIAQLHLMAILGLSFGLGMFLLFSRALRWKEIFFCAAIVIAMQLPIIVYEIKTSGGNYKSLIKAINKKGSSEEGHYWHEKIFRAYQTGANITWLIVTGGQNTDEILTRGLTLKCDKKCKTSLPSSLVAMLIFCCALISAYYARRFAASENKKRAVTLVLFLFGGFFIITILLAYQLETRFYLGVAPLFFLLLGFLLQGIMHIGKGIWIKGILIIVGIIMILLNFNMTITYLRELSVSQTSAVESSRDLRFGTAPKVTLGQMRSIAGEANYWFKQGAPVIVSGESLYVKAMYYLLFVEQGYDGCYVHGDMQDVPAGFNNIAIAYTESASDSEFENNLSLKRFGTLTATFKTAGTSLSDESLPEKCLTY